MTSPAITVRIASFALLLVVAFGSRVVAQEPATTFVELSRVVKRGNTVFVQDEQGERTKGKITELSDKSLQIITGGVSGRSVTFQADRVMRVSKVDSRLNGFLIGAIAGAVPGLLAGHWWNTYLENEAGDPSPLSYLVFGLPLSLAGGGIGFAIDGAIDGQTLAFRRPNVTLSIKF